MDFSADIILENSRALLRPLTATDADLLLPAAADPELWRYTLTRADDRASLDAYVAAALQGRAQALRYPFVIIDKQTGRAAGSTSYYNIVPHEQRLSIGYTWIGTDFQRTGLNRAAKHLLLRYAFDELQCERVELETDARNHKSQNAMRQMGATEEGRLRSHRPTQGGIRRDTILFSIIRPEWEQLRHTVFGAFNTARG
ncbi:GNAT family N-acetyltransferase [Hymenobacter psychrotolerans]|uniref:Protein N-acetyltransferase, RimJ/RimL family n=1 Tax=Hymenobacter psychrotolerans DSM 18569 TaxID=1121959 RepID=A0A1M7C7U5_9BACT|nr:GNAT family protein [Hymenobacter psychrotolerans]SHL63291.1 Protein N-acetyltransferase, RimJ/RimL family [Hymenobacter psychrotolerans DSM 18569]